MTLKLDLKFVNSFWNFNENVVYVCLLTSYCHSPLGELIEPLLKSNEYNQFMEMFRKAST